MSNSRTGQLKPAITNGFPSIKWVQYDFDFSCDKKRLW